MRFIIFQAELQRLLLVRKEGKVNINKIIFRHSLRVQVPSEIFLIYSFLDLKLEKSGVISERRNRSE